MSKIVGFLDENGRPLSRAQARSRVAKHCGALNVPKDPEKWRVDRAAAAGVRFIRDSERPATTEFETAEFEGYESLSDGTVRRKWRKAPRFKTRRALVEHQKRKATQMCSKRWREGRVTVDGVPFKTDETGIALLQTATYYNRKHRCVVVDGQVHRRSPEQLRAAKVACDNYVQSCFDHLAELCEQIDAAEDPSTVDVTAGWPEAE